MNTSDTNEEALREALLNVQRMRAKEKAALEQSETLIKGLQILNESSSITDIFRKILGTLQRVIPFESAAILIETTDGHLSTAVCTDNRLKFSRLPIQGIFKRGIDGRATVLTNMSRIAEWPKDDSSHDLLVVAEGVETEQQLTVLQHMNCDLIQGYLLAKPMTLSDFKTTYCQSQPYVSHQESWRSAS